MKTLITMVVVGCVALAGNALGGSGCAQAKESAAQPKSCGYKTSKAGHRGGCSALKASDRDLAAAGADVEVVKTKKGYIVVATAKEGAGVARVRAANAARLRVATSDSGKDCENCGAFARAVKAGEITYQAVEVENGVLTVYTANTDAALATLGKCCSVIGGLQAQASSSEGAIEN